MATLALLHDLFFINCCHPNIVEFPPDTLVVVFDKRKVMTAFSTAIMDANGMQVVGNIWQSLVNMEDLVGDHLNLVLKACNLLSCCF